MQNSLWTLHIPLNRAHAELPLNTTYSFYQSIHFVFVLFCFCFQFVHRILLLLEHPFVFVCCCCHFQFVCCCHFQFVLPSFSLHNTCITFVVLPVVVYPVWIKPYEMFCWEPVSQMRTHTHTQYIYISFRCIDLDTTCTFRCIDLDTTCTFRCIDLDTPCTFRCIDLDTTCTFRCIDLDTTFKTPRQAKDFLFC